MTESNVESSKEFDRILLLVIPRFRPASRWSRRGCTMHDDPGGIIDRAPPLRAKAA